MTTQTLTPPLANALRGEAAETHPEKIGVRDLHFYYGAL